MDLMAHSKSREPIEEDDVPDVFYWECNKYVDALATQARLDFSNHGLMRFITYSQWQR